MNYRSTFGLKDVHRRLEKAYYGDCKPKVYRPLVITVMRATLNEPSAVLFALHGSPPKAYALYLVDWRRLLFFDRSGDKALPTRRGTVTGWEHIEGETKWVLERR